jgi:esterase/lipase superfamily enzyme
VQPSPSSTTTSTNTAADDDDDDNDRQQQRVEFHAYMKASRTGAVVLRDIIDTGRTYRPTRQEAGGWWVLRRQASPIFTGVPISPAKVESAIVLEQAAAVRVRSIAGGINDDQPTHMPPALLLCVHGFRTQPADWLTACAAYDGGHFTVVPVVWPASDERLFWEAYDEDRDNAPSTGAAFRPLFECLEQITGPKSLMCHSMGNFILKWSAPLIAPKQLFDNIFMVAADVDRDIFAAASSSHDDDDESNTTPNAAAGQRILNLAHRVHVLYSNLDLALWGRQTATIRKPALGFHGPPREADRKVTSLKCNDFARSDGDFWAGHSYFFSKNAIEYYESSSLSSATK